MQSMCGALRGTGQANARVCRRAREGREGQREVGGETKEEG